MAVSERHVPARNDTPTVSEYSCIHEGRTYFYPVDYLGNKMMLRICADCTGIPEFRELIDYNKSHETWGHNMGKNANLACCMIWHDIIIGIWLTVATALLLLPATCCTGKAWQELFQDACAWDGRGIRMPSRTWPHATRKGYINQTASRMKRYANWNLKRIHAYVIWSIWYCTCGAGRLEWPTCTFMHLAHQPYGNTCPVHRRILDEHADVEIVSCACALLSGTNTSR